MHLETGGGMLIKAVPDREGSVNKGLLCARGRFGFDCAELEERLNAPLVKHGNVLEQTDYHEAAVRTAKAFRPWPPGMARTLWPSPSPPG